MKKKMHLKLKIRTLLTFIITIVLFGYLSFSVIYYQVSVKKYEKEHLELQEKLYELKDQEVDLNNEIIKLKDEDYLARYAREEYLYSKEGEYVIKIEEKEEENSQEITKEKNFKFVYFVPILILPTLFIIIKKKMS